MRMLKRRPSAAMSVAFIALAVAIGGTASALPGKKSVDQNDLRKNVVGSKNVKDGNLTGGDVGDGSLTGGDVGDGSLTGVDVQDASLTGGDVTDDQITGSDVNEATLKGLLGNAIKVRKVTDANFDAGDVTVLTATCQAGETLIGGGSRVPVTGAAGARPYVSESAPVVVGSGSDTPNEGDTPDAWLVRGVNDSANNDQTLIVFAVCAGLGS
jgi:hypothetical protein